MIDDRMPPENLKEVAAAIMQQSFGAASEGALSTAHPDKAFAGKLFGGSHAIHESSELSAVSEEPRLNLASLNRRPAVQKSRQQGESRKSLREDLVQQAAQSLVKNQVDAFLAVTSRLSPDEVLASLQVARQWRRSDDGWQDDFRQAPETGFQFIDRQSGAKKAKEHKKQNRAESLAREIAGLVRGSRVPSDDVPKVVRAVLRERKIRLSEDSLRAFCAKVSGLAGKRS